MPLWDKARWTGMAYGWDFEAQLPFMGPVFDDRISAEAIFSEWQRNIGDQDYSEKIRISVIESSRDASDTSYHVHISENWDVLVGSLAVEDRVMLISRHHQMTPSSASPNLRNFKNQLAQSGKFLFVPACVENSEIHPLFEWGITKRVVHFRYLDEIGGTTDPDCVIIRCPQEDNPASPKTNSSHRAPSPEQVTAIIENFEMRAMQGTVPVRFDPMIIDRIYSAERNSDGYIKPESIDPILLSLAEITAEDSFVKACLSRSLLEVQREYANILLHHFGPIKSLIDKHGLDENEFSRWISDRQEIKDEFARRSGEFYAALTDFWETNAHVVRYHLRNMPTIKAVYGGSGFPRRCDNLWANALLYADTLVVPDPFLGTLFMGKNASAEESLYWQVKHCVHAIDYAELAISETEPPLVVFMPTLPLLDENLMNLVKEYAGDDLAKHMSKVFDFPMQSFDAVQNFFETAGSVENLLMAVRNPEMFLLSADAARDPRSQAEDNLDYMDDVFGTGEMPQNMCLLMAFYGRWLQNWICRAQADMIGGVPLIDAKVSWKYFLWGLQQFRETYSGEQIKDIMVQHAVLSSSEKIPVIRKVAREDLIIARRKQSLASLRETVANGIESIADFSDETPDNVANAVAANIDKAIRASADEVKNLTETAKGLAFESAGQVVTTGITIAAACQRSVPLAVVAAVMRTFGFKSVRDISKDARQVVDGVRKRQRNPVGLFFG